MTLSNNQPRTNPAGIRFKPQAGVALVAALLLLLVITAMAVTLMYTVNTEQHLQRTDSANNPAYYAAESGMEKMMSDLDNLYAPGQISPPTPAQIRAVGSPANQPALPGVQFPEYTVTVLPPPQPGPNNAELLSSGPNAGLMATVQPLELTVTAVRPGGEQVRLRSDVQVALIPIFQFGAFTQGDMSYFPGSDFQFTGRLQSNGNLFVVAGTNLVFHNQIRASGDIIRDQLPNGVLAANGRTGQVLVPQAPSGCDGAPPPGSAPACRGLQLSPAEQSANGGPLQNNGGTGVANSQWQAVSQQTYNSMILSGSTGAQRLAFPSSDPIQMIRRPPPGESPTSPVGASRLYNQAQIRVLLADNPAELPCTGIGCNGANDPQNIRLANFDNAKYVASTPDYSAGVPVDAAPGTQCASYLCTYFAQAKRGHHSSDWTIRPVLDAQNGHSSFPSDPDSPFILDLNNWSLVEGWLRVEVVHADGTVSPVTAEWLQLGFARDLSVPTAPGAKVVNPNAILVLQLPSDRNGPGVPESPLVGATSVNNWYPINMYDVREGEFRQGGANNCKIGGIMNLVEIDVGNLKRWLQGATGATGTQVDFQKQNGYVLYFSDRRGMIPSGGLKTGRYGFEDVVNPSDTQGNPNKQMDVGEDLLGPGLSPPGSGPFENFGGENLGLGFGIPQPPGPSQVFSQPNTPIPDGGTPGAGCQIARKNWVSGTRHALRLVDGGLGNLPAPPGNNGGGFTVASENPVYILGNYNSTGAFADGDGHVSSAVIADAVTLLSGNWQDNQSFLSPNSGAARAVLNDTWYRVAIATGRNLNFPNAPVVGAPPTDFGTDGGMHNFLRLLETWSGHTLHYRGSMVSPYYSQYATGVFKCCGMVYQPPTRDYEFDLDFQDVKKMPPGTPMLRNVINLGFQQVFY